jgi:VIT1/CCC1 family predicted Fe2+/Mn2+ transporter
VTGTEPSIEQAHVGEQHHGDTGARLNWLRAGVLGANDGIVSTAGIVAGVAGATAQLLTIATAGVAGLVAGAFSMAGGEYVSVSTQRDTETALLRREKWELEHLPGDELAELAGIYQAKGLAPDLAQEVARQLTAKDALHAHAEAELGIDPDGLTNPWTAAGASFVSFVGGALLPLLAILLPPQAWRVPVCMVAVVVALALTGTVSARLGGAPVRRAVVRNVGLGLLAMMVTYAVGLLVGGVTG